MSNEKTINIEELAQDAHNFNKGTDKGRELMERSLQELGAGRSILIDKNGNIIAGNKTQEAAIKAGIKKVRVIETTGDELVAVKRMDVDIDSKKGRELALVDNFATQVNLSWDKVELDQVTAEQGIDLPDWGIDPKDLGIEEEKPFVPKDEEDISDQLEITYRVEATCEDEEQQQELFNELKERGYKCRILTL